VRTDVREYAKPGGYYLREASPKDLEQYQELRGRAEDLKWLLRARARQNGTVIKIVALEFTLDEGFLTVSYSSEEQPQLRVLAQELIAYTGARIDFNNVGPRDQARMLGTVGACGMGSCSSTWLQGFSAVSIRMARDQQLPLNPEKISGPCGRLMCCLQFEHTMYKELLRELPRKGGQVCHTESGACGRIVKVHPLKGTVELKHEDRIVGEFPADSVTPVNQRGKA
jgi:cell fate regulator YaaT (PSP1 superfamily)